MKEALTKKVRTEKKPRLVKGERLMPEQDPNMGAKLLLMANGHSAESLGLDVKQIPAGHNCAGGCPLIAICSGSVITERRKIISELSADPDFKSLLGTAEAEARITEAMKLAREKTVEITTPPVTPTIIHERKLDMTIRYIKPARPAPKPTVELKTKPVEKSAPKKETPVQVPPKIEPIITPPPQEVKPPKTETKKTNPKKQVIFEYRSPINFAPLINIFKSKPATHETKNKSQRKDFPPSSPTNGGRESSGNTIKTLRENKNNNRKQNVEKINFRDVNPNKNKPKIIDTKKEYKRKRSAFKTDFVRRPDIAPIKSKRKIFTGEVNQIFKNHINRPFSENKKRFVRQTEVFSKNPIRAEKIKTKGIIFSRKEPGLEKEIKIKKTVNVGQLNNMKVETPFEKKLFVKKNEKIFKLFLATITKTESIKKEIRNHKQQDLESQDEKQEQQSEEVMETMIYLAQQAILFQTIMSMEMSNQTQEILDEQTENDYDQPPAPEEINGPLIHRNINMQAVTKLILTIFYLINQVVF